MPTTTLLDWNTPLLSQVTQRLLSFSSGPIVDLGTLLVVVPTGQSGRRLREALALELAKDGRGLLPPQIVTPDLLLTEALKASDQEIANETQCTAAWVEVLSQISFDRFQALFPVPPDPSLSWQLGMAHRLMQLRNELGEEGLTLSEAAKRAAEVALESERWNQLARLEGLYLDQLQSKQLSDPKQARRAAATAYTRPDGIERIILAATPDPQALPLQALQQIEAQIPIEVWIYADQAEQFDAWGRPLTEIWQQRSLDLEGWNCQLSTQTDFKQTANKVAQLTAGAEPESILVGLTNPEINPVIADSFRAAGIACYDPEGEALHHGSVGRLAECLCELASANSPSIHTLRSLLQHPDFTAWLSSEVTSTELLKQLDKVFEKHLAADLDGLLSFTTSGDYWKALHHALTQIQSLRAQLLGKQLSSNLAHTLQSMYAERTLQHGTDASIPFAERAKAIRKLLEQSAATEASFQQLPKDFTRSTFNQALKTSKVYPDRPTDAHDLLGWLELLWNDAPHLILAGMNEGSVPEAVVGDAFLPENMREALGLRTNAQRFARDVYLIEALCRRRAQDKGRIDILVPQSAADATPLKPSRLLFLGAPETLLPRTRALFSESDHPHGKHTHHTPWTLSPPSGIALPERLSVSALKNYLECPFRFFLRHILHMRPVDVASRELTPATFGNLVHDTLDLLSNEQVQSAKSPQELIKTLHALAERLIQHRYGKQLSFALRIQKEAALHRLNAFAEHQFEDIKANGSIQIIDTESQFDINVAEMPIRGRIDRIDQRGDRIELIDYKTADSPKTPQEAHLKTVAKKAPPAHLPGAAFFEHEGKTYRWVDLQLPLYVLSQQQGEQIRPSVAYFNLAKTLDKSGLTRWEDFTQSHLDSALACAEAIIGQIKAGVFWPPNPDVREDYDDFAPLFPDGIEKSVNKEAFEAYQFKD